MKAQIHISINFAQGRKWRVGRGWGAIAHSIFGKIEEAAWQRRTVGQID